MTHQPPNEPQNPSERDSDAGFGAASDLETPLHDSDKSGAADLNQAAESILASWDPSSDPDAEHGEVT